MSFAYEEEKPVLHNINFEAPSGSVIALVGSSGSGKSTIAGLSATFLNPASGVITIDGQDLSKVKLSSFRQNLGVVLQDEFLFEGTIRENIMFPRPNATEAQLQNAVKAAYVNEFTDRFDQGLEILDEATSNLDTESEGLIQKSLSELTNNRTTIVIAHRLSTIKRANQILVIEAGRIAERGTHDELIKVKGRYYDLYTFQAKI